MKVGDYVRTNVERLNIQQICKIKKILSDDFIFTDRGYYDKEYIIKSSPNIMDLIEENDYIRTINDTDFRRVYMSYGKLVIEKYGLELSIKKLKLAEIITSQQFSQMKYKVESEVN